MARDLSQLRVEIDTVDRELLKLLTQRAALANEVGAARDARPAGAGQM